MGIRNPPRAAPQPLRRGRVLPRPPATLRPSRYASVGGGVLDDPQAALFGRKSRRNFCRLHSYLFAAMWTLRCDKRGLSPETFQIRSHSGGHPPPRKAMQGQAQADRLCFGAHFSARTALVTPDHKKENQNFSGRKTGNHPSGRPQRDRQEHDRL